MQEKTKTKKRLISELTAFCWSPGLNRLTKSWRQWRVF